jgi:small subunit ribosomal protein S21
MAYVERKQGEGLEKMLKRFRRKLNESGQLRAYRRKRFFISKSELKRDKRRRAERRRRRQESRRRQREDRRRGR